MQTWGLLEDPANSHLITWTAAGDAFVVVQPEAFARELLPTVFKHNNYTSFVRQLNIYVRDPRVCAADHVTPQACGMCCRQ